MFTKNTQAAQATATLRLTCVDTLAMQLSGFEIVSPRSENIAAKSWHKQYQNR